jgi:NADH dehydrogenase
MRQVAMPLSSSIDPCAWSRIEAAERAGVERLLFFSALNASAHNRTRFLRAKALAEEAVRASSIAHTVFAPSIIYAPGDPYMTLLARLALLPVMPVSGAGRAEYQPIWAHDVADCIMAVLEAGAGADDRYELAGPETLSHRQIVELALRAQHRHRRIVHVPTPIVSRTLRVVEALMKSKAPATWDEAELMEVSLLTERGTADAERLGVEPRFMAAVLDAP